MVFRNLINLSRRQKLVQIGKDTKRRRTAHLARARRISRVENLEERRLLATVEISSGVLTFNNDGVEENDLTLSLDADGNLVLEEQTNEIETGSGVTDMSFDPMTVVIPAADLAQLNSLEIHTHNGDDLLVIDNSNGLIPATITYDGAEGFDSLRLIGSTSADTTYNPGPTVDAGFVVQESGSASQRVDFYGLEPIQVLAPVGGNNILNLSAAPLGGIGFPGALESDNAINFKEGPSSNDPADLVFAGALTGFLTVDGFESLEFANFEVLNIDGGAGNDTINLNNPVLPNELGIINVDGGDPTASDTVIVNGTPAEDDIIVDSLGSDGAEVTGAQLAVVNITTTEHLVIDGQGGDDFLTYRSPGAGADITYNAGAHVDSGSITADAFDGNSLLPISFENLGSSGRLIFDNSGGGRTDGLDVIGTDNDDLFTLRANGRLQIFKPALEVPTSLPISTPGVTFLRMMGGNGSDEFQISGVHPIDTGIEVQGGSPGSGSDLLTVTGGEETNDSVVIEQSVINSTKQTITGYASQIDVSGMERIEIVGHSNDSDTLNVLLGDGNNIARVDAGANIGDSSADVLTADSLPDIGFTGLSHFTATGESGSDSVTFATRALTGVVLIGGTRDYRFDGSGTDSLIIEGVDGDQEFLGDDRWTVTNPDVGTFPADPPVQVVDRRGNGAVVTAVNVDLGRLQIDGRGGDDAVTVDVGNTDLIGVPITFDGGAGDDLMIIDGDPVTPVVTTTYRPGPNVNEGRLTYDSNMTIDFVNLEPVVDLVAAINLVINGTNADNAINYTAGAFTGPPANPVNPLGLVTGMVSVDGFETLEFSEKTRLIINGNAGDDKINLNNDTTPTNLASITVNGNDPTASDTVVVNGSAAMDTITVDTLSSDGALVTGAQPVPVLVASAEHLIVNGLGGEDELTIETPSGQEQIQFTPGEQPDSGSVLIESLGSQSLIPISFTGLGLGAQLLEFTDADGTQADDLFVVGTDHDERFTVNAAGSIFLADAAGIPTTPVITTDGVANAVLQGLSGSDEFFVAGDHPFDAVLVEGGNPGGGSDVLLFSGSGAAVSHSPDNAAIVEAGAGAVSYDGVERVVIDANSSLVVEGSIDDDLVRVTPENTDNDGTYEHSAGAGIAFEYSDAGSVTFHGEGGSDQITVLGDAASNTIVSLGVDISVDASDVTIGNDVESVVIDGLSGNDLVDLSLTTLPRTTVYGREGNDRIFGTIRNADFTIAQTTNTLLVLDGGVGDDELTGGSSSDRIIGGDGNDQMDGAPGRDVMLGGADSDQFRWTPGDDSDLVEGGTGVNDEMLVITSDNADLIQLYGGGIFDDSLFGLYTPQMLLNGTRAIVDLNFGSDFINTGDVEAFEINTRGGEDSIVINNQADFTSRGDSPVGGAVAVNRGTDLGPTATQSVKIDGGDDIDYVDIHGTYSDDNIDVDFVGGDVTVTGTGVEIHIANDLAGGDTLHVHGQSGDDNIKAAPSVEVVMSITLEGDNGDDVLDADAILIGGAGDDFLQGGVGDDLLLGGAGEDTMVGGLGNDSFDGGSGFDTILIAGTSDDDVIDVIQTNPSTLTHTVNGDTQTDIIAPSTVERALVEAGDGADLIRVNWQDAIGVNGADDSLRMTVHGGDDSTFDRLVVIDDGTDDLTLYRKGVSDDSGTVQVGPGNAEPLLSVFEEVERVQFLDENGLAIDNTAGPQLVVFKHDPFEYNDDRFTATYLGSGDTINVDPTIDPGALVNPFGDGQNVPGDDDYYRVVAESTGTLDFQVYFRHVETLASGRPGLPNGGDLNIAVRDADGNVIAGFGTNDGDDDERVRIPAVQGETYYLQVVGALAAVNVYNITVVNHAPPVPYTLELLDNPADGTTNPPGGSTNSDTGRSQFDNHTYDDTPTLFFRLDDGIFLHDLPGNPADATPPDEVIPIPFQPGLAQPNQPGFAIAVFDEGDTPPQTGTAPQTPLGFATAVAGQEGVYTFTVPNGLALSEGSHFLTARVQMIDPAVAQETGFGGRSLPLEIVVDTTAPPVVLGLQSNPDDGLHPDSDSGDAALPITFDDRITNDETPTFFGRAEANAIVRAYLDLDDSSTLSAGDLLIGQTVATPLDGTNQLETPLDPNEPGGQWQLTSTVNMNDPDVLAALGLPKDGLRRILISAEDLAGNITPPDANEILEVFIDSQGPQVTDVYISAFPAFDIFTLKPDTPQPTPRVDSLTIALRDLPERIAPFFYDAVSNVPPLAPIVLVGDHSGVIPIANLAYISTNAGPGIATGEIVLDFVEPLPDDRFTLTLADSIIDPAGNQLDGENNAAEPIGSPFFPTGDEIPGGDFIARFTVDSRPEVATWSQGIVYADINGNFVWDPEGQDNDYTNRDFAYNFGELTDAYFAGNFSAIATSSYFDKVGAYGAFNGTYEFFLDTDDDGVGDTVGAMAFQVNAIPVAGNFFNSAADDAAVLAGGRPRDEIGAFDGQNWYLDVNGNNNIDAGEQFATNLRGIPVVGDFNGDGNDDLATFNNDTGIFQFDLDRNGTVDDQVTFGFSGFGERPVAGDFNLDGIDDIGMWVPGREGQLPKQSGEFHFLISDAVANLPSNVFEPFSPAPLGNDLISQFGDEFALPLFGNFDPPIAKDGSGATFVGSLTNDHNPLDTNGDGTVTALDALVVINALGNLENTEQTRPMRTSNAFNGYKLDASADGDISALDALFVINGLAQQGSAGSGEQVSAALSSDGWAQSADSAISDLDGDDDDLLSVLAADQELQRVK